MQFGYFTERRSLLRNISTFAKIAFKMGKTSNTPYGIQFFLQRKGLKAVVPAVRSYTKIRLLIHVGLSQYSI